MPWGLGSWHAPARSGLGLSVSSLLGDRLLSNAGRGGGAGAAPGEIRAAGLSSPGVRTLKDNLGPQTRFSRASLPTCFVRGCHSPPPLRKTLGKPQDLTPPAPFRPVTRLRAKYTKPKSTELNESRHRDSCNRRLDYEMGHPSPPLLSTSLSRDFLFFTMISTWK